MDILHCYVFNKPWDCVSARTDGRFRTVLDFFPPDIREISHIVGRLDKDTRGIILVTDDGSIDYRLMRPEHHVPKTYAFHAFGEPDCGKIEMLRRGCEIDGTFFEPCGIRITGSAVMRDICGEIPPRYREKQMKNPNAPVFSGEVTITEGKTHQVRRMLRYAGSAVLSLTRVAIGGLTIGSCPDFGAYRELTAAEIDAL